MQSNHLQCLNLLFVFLNSDILPLKKAIVSPHICRNFQLSTNNKNNSTMKRLFTILSFSCMCITSFGFMHSSCDDDISVIQNHYSISFGDTIETGISTELQLSISWNVSPQKGVNKISGTGKTTGNLIFSQPGKYQITFQIPAHGDHPAKTETVTVEVSNVKMEFDTKNIRFSKELTAGDASGTVMVVPVTVKMYEGNTYTYTTREIKTTGVGQVSSRLKEGTAELKNGHNELFFELSGTISQQGNIQFRVYDAKGEATFFNKSIN